MKRIIALLLVFVLAIGGSAEAGVRKKKKAKRKINKSAQQAQKDHLKRTMDEKRLGKFSEPVQKQ